MPEIDYMKVLDIAALTLETSSHIEINALDLRLYRAELVRDDGSIIEIIMKINEFDIELSFSNNVLEKKAFEKWLKNFEYHLEQNFYTNISIETSAAKQEYRIKILF